MEVEEVPYQFLEDITDGFSEDRQLGAGAYGAVYRGVIKNGTDVAVKILKDNSGLDSQQFRDEFHHLRMLNNHPNIVQVLGYCYETKKTPMQCNGKTVLAETTHKALCFEYLQNGSLRKHISDEFEGLDWHTRYNIIKGICEGLQYIHKEQGEEHLYHLDLKPDNILLDDKMVPKIADFGTSKIFRKQHPASKELKVTMTCCVGTHGYQPPEHIDRGEISEKFDIFSLGVVMIEIMSGRNGRYKCADIPNDEFIDLEKNNWRSRLQATWTGSSLEAYCNQVETCTKIALSCTENDSHRRPSIKDIIGMLKEAEIKVAKSTPLQVEPPQLQFCLFEQDKLMMPCSLKLINHTDNKVVFRLVTKNPKHFLFPLFGVVNSRNTYTLDVTRHIQLLKPQEDEEEFTLESIIVRDHEIGNAISYSVDSYNNCFFEKAKESGHEMHQVKLTIVHRPPVLKKATTKLPERYHTIVSSLSSSRIPDQHQNPNLIRSTSNNELDFVNLQETPLEATEEFIVGRAQEKKKIIDSLLVSMLENTFIILPIYGIGGIGKTTFAKLIYNDFKHYSRVWVYVSPVFDINMIRSSIISQLNENDSRTDESQKIHCRKNIMIVLDDLWEVKQYELNRLKDILHQGGSSNTVVLVTTRSKDVAKRICINHVPYKIESLTDDMCWDIIKQRSSFEARHDKVQLTSIGRAIAKKCEGVALAAKSIGFMLQSKGFDVWKQVKESDIWNESISSENAPATNNNVLASLKLSYENMGKSLKLCFTYCAIFPKGHKIVGEDLIHHWLSLGFITATNLLSPKQRCENYIAQLLGLSFLQHSVLPTSSRAYAKDVVLFTMHDLVHDLATLVMGHGVLDASKQGVDGERSSQYALLTDCSKPLGSYTSYPKEIRSLLFTMHCGKINEWSREFSSAKSLEVLDLSGCSIGQLPYFIDELVQLRYLKAPNIESRQVPECVSKLSKLIYLNISGSLFPALPESIGELNDLMYLDISYCVLLEGIPKSFQRLRRLVYLNLSNCWCYISDDLLHNLTNLEYLNLSREESSLLTLSLLKETRATAPLPSVPDIGNLIQLRYLGLSNAIHNDTFSLLEKICTLSNIERLDLSHNPSIVRVPDSIRSLKKLHTLDLSGCRQLPGLPESIVEMDSLNVLNVAGCSKLNKQSAAPSESNTIAFLPHFKVRAQVDGCSSNIGVLQHTDPEELHISSLDNVKSAEEARSVKLTQKHGMGSLTVEWTRGAGRCVEDMELLAELVPPINLMKFCVKGYNSASFPCWIMGIALQLPNLIKIELCDVPEIICLPPLGQLPNLQELVLEGLDRITTIGESFCGGARAFPQLTKFRLRRMENLEEWNTMYLCVEDGVKKFMFANLEDLSICYCLKLKLKPCPPRARIWEVEYCSFVLSSMRDGGTAILPAFFSSAAAGAITQLRIKRCTDITAFLSPKIFPSLAQIKSLWLEEIIDLDEIPEWFGNLVDLQELVITRCTELRNLPHLRSLQLLSLKGCHSITALPEWPGSYLNELVISDCRGIKSLPKCILTNLERLYIYYWCSELAQWCKENMMQFDHIQHKIMQDNSSQFCRISLFAEEQRAIEHTIAFLPHFMVCAQLNGCSSNICVLRHVYPEELHISSLDNVKSAEEARSVKLIQKQGMGSLTLEWTRGAGRSVEDMELLAELVPPINLMKFSMKGYNSASFPGWVMGIALHLPDLVKIELCDVTEIISPPPLGQLSNLQELVLEGLDRITTIGESFCGGARAFPRLTKFRLRRMENLEEWHTMYFCGKDGVKKFMFPNLKNLSVCDCLKLRLKPCPPRATIWEVENSDHVLSSWRDGDNGGETAWAASSSSAAATITQFRIVRCTDILAFLSPKINTSLPVIESLWLEEIIYIDEIPEWVGNLVGLQELVIRRCTELRNLQPLSSVRLLSLKECPKITALPEWPGSCLKELVISDCGGIKTLPKSILTNLEQLYVYSCCSEFAQWCKENMMLFHHIEDKMASQTEHDIEMGTEYIEGGRHSEGENGEAEDGDDNVEEQNARKPMAAMSEIWQHFIKIKDDKGVVKKVKCKYCGRLMRADLRLGTSAMTRHFNVCKLMSTTRILTRQL